MEQVLLSRYFRRLNFHPSQQLMDIKEWLFDPAGLPLVLQGQNSSGREYYLQSTSFERELHELPFKVLVVDWGLQGGMDHNCPFNGIIFVIKLLIF